MQPIQAFVEAYLIPAQLVLAMLGMGATLGVRDFAAIGKNPRALLVGLGIQWLVVPALALIFIATFGLTPGWAVGLLLAAVVPVGALSNLMTFFARGNVALSISLTASSTLASVLTIPLLLRTLASGYLPADFELPTLKIVIDVCAFLLAPLIVGMVVQRVSPTRAPLFSKVCMTLCLLMLATVTASSLGSGRIKVYEYGWLPPARIVGFAVCIVVITPLVCRLLRRPDNEAIALSIGTMVRNMGVSLLFVQRFFPGQRAQAHVLYTCLFFAGLTGPFAVMGMLRHRRGKSALPLLPRWQPEPTAPGSRTSEAARRPPEPPNEDQSTA